MIKYTIQKTHIDLIRPGDTVVIDGQLRTVCASNLKRNSFFGRTLFGDNYKGGREPVLLAIIHHAKPELIK